MAIDLGADFPRNEEQIKWREAIEEALENALYCIRYDPLAGNAAHEIARALEIIESK